MTSLLQDLRYAGRALRRSPGFALTAAITLALGIGASTAIFTLLDRVVLRPLPYADPEQLVFIDSPVPYAGEGARWGLSEAGYFFFREHNRSFEEIGAFSGAFGEVEFGVASERGAARVQGAQVSASLLDVLRARPALGRLIGPEDDQPGPPSVAVLGHAFWVRQYGADPGVIGSTIELEGTPVEVIGVMQPDVHLPKEQVDVWIPLGLDPTQPPVNSHWVRAVGRLKDGVAPADAERDLALLTSRFTEAMPEAYSESFMRESGFSTAVTPLRDHVIGDVGRTLWILFGSVGLVLLIACANVTNLFLVRTEARRRERAVRSALGAGRAELARHSLTESLLLALVAGAAGVWLAGGAIRVLLSLSPSGLPRLAEVGISAGSVAFAFAVSLLAGIVFGLFPVMRSRADYSALRDGGRGVTVSRGQQTVRGVMVVGQIALAVVLLAAAGLMLRSFQQLRSVEPGLDPDNVLALELSLPAVRYQEYGDVQRFYRELITQVEALPGVRSAGAGTRLPLKDTQGCSSVFVEDRPLAPGEQPPCVGTPLVAPGFFRTLGIPVRGREPAWADVEQRTGEVVVTQALAERLWPGEDPIGKGIRGNGARPPYYRVAGVTGELRGEGLDAPPTEAVFFPMLPMEGAWLWSPPRSMRLVVRTETAQPQQLTAAIRRILAEMDPAVPIGDVQTMNKVIATSASVARTSFAMLLLGIGAGMALLLSAVGLYGVISYVVGQRQAELGIRMALGARMEQVAGMVVRQSARLALAGVAVGIAAALAATRLLRSLLFEVDPADPLTLGAVSVLLIAVALLASYLPARRAARVDPMTALRSE